jgi:AraC-like DNA-binding protein
LIDRPRLFQPRGVTYSFFEKSCGQAFSVTEAKQTEAQDVVLSALARICDEWAQVPRRIEMVVSDQPAGTIRADAWRLTVFPDLALISNPRTALPRTDPPAIDVRYNRRMLFIYHHDGEVNKVRAFDAGISAPVAAVEQLFLQAQAAVSRGHPRSQRLAHTLCQGILGMALEHALHPVSPHAGKVARKRQTFYRLDAFVGENLDRASSVRDAARHLGMSPQYLNRVCRRYRSLTYSAYLNLRRLERARVRLLKEPKLSVAELAEQCEFNSPAYFVKNFRELYGLPPSRLRRTLRRAGNTAETELHTIRGFELLQPLPEVPVTSGSNDSAHLSVVIINTSKQLFEVDWLSQDSEMVYQGQLTVGMRWIIGVAHNQVLQIRNEDQVTYYRTGDQNCQILV